MRLTLLLSGGVAMKQQHVPFCCACGKVKDEIGAKAGENQWVDLHSYRMTHGFQVADLGLTKTYCVDCGHLYQLLKKHSVVRSTAEEKPSGQGGRLQNGANSYQGQ